MQQAIHRTKMLFHFLWRYFPTIRNLNLKGQMVYKKNDSSGDIIKRLEAEKTMRVADYLQKSESFNEINHFLTIDLVFFAFG